MNNRIDYSTETAQKQLTELQNRYSQYVSSQEIANSKRSNFQKYVNFLHSSEGYPKNKIAEVTGLTRERVGQIIQKFSSRKGGDRT